MIVFVLLSTLSNFILIYIINLVLTNDPGSLSDHIAIYFLLCVFGAYGINIFYQKHLNHFNCRILYEEERNMIKQIINTDLSTLEKMGTQRLYAIIEDIRVFARLPAVVTNTLSAGVMLLLGVIYMFTLSFISAAIIVGIIGLIATIYFKVMKLMSDDIMKLRKLGEQYYVYVDDLFKGFKNFRISARKRVMFLEKFLYPNRLDAEKLDYRVNFVFISLSMTSQYGMYIVLAIILFALPALELISFEALVSYVVVLLFISGPITALVNLQASFTRFRVAIRRIKAFKADFKEILNGQNEREETTFESLEFKGLTFRYHNENGQENFTLGPIDFSIKQGEVVFISGGNGSGKSTFVNLFTGLYPASEGQLLLNGKTEESPHIFQQLMSSVFTEGHLFTYNYHGFPTGDNPQFRNLVEMMKLSHLISPDYRDNAGRRFSKGQTKRLGLIYALMEKKPIIVLDEWAADQDPFFRRFFYEELIPSLKKQGKTILAVTHDDTYYHHADRLIHLDQGKMRNSELNLI